MVMSGGLKLKLINIMRIVGLVLFLSLGVADIAMAQIRFDRPKSEAPLNNPYTMGVPREQIIGNVREVLKGCGINIREDAGQSNGRLVTDPIVFARGVTTRSNLEYLAVMPSSEVRNWQQGRFHLEITALPLDQKRSQLYVVAHIEGRYSDPSRGAVWIEGQSNGRLEDEVLRGLAGKILGIDLSLKTATNERRILGCTF